MRFQDALCKLEDVWHISNDLVTDLEEFTCAMYVSLHYFEAEVSNIDILCHNLSSKAVRVTHMVSIHMFLGARISIMPMKNVSVLWKIYKQLFKRIFRAFSVIFLC